MVAGRDRDSAELKAVAPLIAVAGDTRRLVGPVLLVANAGKTIGVTSAEIVRAHRGAPLRVLTELAGSTYVEIADIGLGRYAGVGLLELAHAIPGDAAVAPLGIDRVNATSDPRGAPAGIVSIRPIAAGFERVLIPVDVDSDDGGGMSDTVTRLASPLDPAHVGLDVEGAPVFAWFPPNPALGRPSEVLAVAIAYPYRAGAAKPRALPVLAELVGLDDLGRALISTLEHVTSDHEERRVLEQVSGEIADKDEPDPLAGLDD